MTTDLERAAQKRLAYGHNDTCSYILSDTYACTCGHAELEAALSPAQPEGWVRSLVYLACPYSHDWSHVRESRFKAANLAAGELMRQGLHVFSPISHTHPIAECCNLPIGFDFWEAYDRAILACCSKVIVLQIEGWRESKGVTAEIAIAKELGIPVEYMPSPPSPASPEGENTDIWCHTCDSVAPIDYKCSHPGCPIMKRASADTPRTNAEIFNAYDEEGDALPAINVDFARTLEREAARLQGELAEAKAKLKTADGLKNTVDFRLKQRAETAELRLAEREKELEGMRADAGRYRWLRAYHWDDVWDWCIHNADDDSPPCISPEATDAAIDAAMKGKP